MVLHGYMYMSMYIHDEYTYIYIYIVKKYQAVYLRFMPLTVGILKIKDE